jgi:hypothetical protein
MSAHDAVPVSLAEIARIAGVGRAAVSNWRRRHDSFPSRIGGTDVSPQFSLAEVEQWRPGTPLAALRGTGQPERVGAGHRRGSASDAFLQGTDRPSRALRASP